MQEFLVHGYAATSMDKIAAAAGVSKATVYSHFHDKTGLFTALIQRLACQKELFVLQELQTTQAEPTLALKHFANQMLNNIAADPQILTFIRLVIGESGRFPELAQAFVKNIEKPGIEVLTGYLASHPALQFPDPEVAARAFIGTLIHFVLVGRVLHGETLLPIERERLIDQLLDLIIGSHQRQIHPS
ncbi:MAG: TetR/AcrR family transcriptional regulator [Cyanobacteria bacterium RM1_2_2]|nr:TetR/AcrR family transcriptional regulator [Cyanobacteria bacterium RM1_2_2]